MSAHNISIYIVYSATVLSVLLVIFKVVFVLWFMYSDSNLCLGKCNERFLL